MTLARVAERAERYDEMANYMKCLGLDLGGADEVFAKVTLQGEIVAIPYPLAP